MTKLRRIGAWSHPCAPWLELSPDIGARLFPGGRDATRATLDARCRRLSAWKAPDAFGSLAERVRREQGPVAGADMERVGQGEPVVLTGQQPSLAGGPMFVWLKAWTAIAHAERASRILGRPVRALFWIAGDDSDLLEVRSLRDPILRETFDSHGSDVSGARQPAGAIPVSEEHREALAASIAASWTDSVLPGLVRAAPDLSTLMRLCLRHWFGDRLLVVDAVWPETRRAALPAYRAFVRSASGVHGDLAVGIERARAAGLPTSIRTWPDRLRLFHLSERGRNRVVADGDLWTDGAARWTDSDLQAELDRSPESFSHDVVSRPFAAETIFPVIAHVLGPGEFAYFACLGPLSSRLESPLAPVLPRASATLLPPGPWSLAREAGWDPVQGRPGSYRNLSDTLLASRTHGEGVWHKLWADARADYLEILGDGLDPSELGGFSKRLEAFEARWRLSRIRRSANEHRDDLESLRRLVALSGEGGLQERLWSPWALEHHLGDSSLLRRLEGVSDPLETRHVLWTAGGAP